MRAKLDALTIIPNKSKLYVLYSFHLIGSL